MATVGSILQVIPARWVDDTKPNEYPIQRTWQWTKNGANIPGAVGGVYTIKPEDAGATIAVSETSGFISPSNNGSTLEVPAVVSTATSSGLNATALASDPTLVQQSNIVYQGSFLLPTQFEYEAEALAFNPSGFSGQKTITATRRNLGNPSGFSSGEFSIPALNQVTNLASLTGLQTAQLLRPTTTLTDPTEGLRTSSGVLSGQGEPAFESKGAGITSDSKYIFSYLANWITSQAYSVFYRRPADLSTTGSVEGPFIVIDPTYQTNPRWTGGNMCAIPSTTVGGVNYQTALGGDFLAGTNGLSNIQTLSDGPSAISFNSASITAALATEHSGIAQGGSSNTIRLAGNANNTDGYYVGQYIVAASACTGARRISAYVGATRTATIEPDRGNRLWNLATPTSSTLYKTTPYVSGRQLIGYKPNIAGLGDTTTPLDDGWNLSGNKFPSVWGRQALAFGMAIPNGTKSLLFIGYNGDGYNNYGDRGQVYEGTKIYDPEEASVHGYPYSGKIWAYNLDELAAVYANPGVVGFNSVKPYAIFNFSLPGAGTFAFREARGVTYDPSTRLLYISQKLKDVGAGGFGYGRTVMHAYLVNNAVASVSNSDPQWVSTITGSSSTDNDSIDPTAIYVAKTGNDTTGTGTSAAPFLTLSKACEFIGTFGSTGKTIYIKSGTYSIESATILAGTVASPVKIKRFPGDTVIIDGANTTAVAISFYGASLEIHGITFKNYTGHAVSIENAGAGYILRNLTFTDCGSIIRTISGCDAINLSNIVYTTSNSSEFSVIDMSIGGCDNITIDKCIITGAGTSQFAATNGIDIGPSGNITVTRCFIDKIKGHAAAIVSSEGNCNISRNYFKQSVAVGGNLLKIYPGFNDTGSGSAYSCIIENNLMIRGSTSTSTDPLLFLENSLGSAIVRRNTIVNKGATASTTVLDDCGATEPLAFGTIASVANGDGIAFTHTTPTLNFNGEYLMDVTCTTLTPHGLSVGDAFAVAKTIVRSTNASPAVQINGEQVVTTVVSPTQFKFTVYTGTNTGLIGIASATDVGYVLHRGLNFTYTVTPGTDYTSEGGLRITAKFPFDARGFEILPEGSKIKIYGTSGDNGTSIDGTWTVTGSSSITVTFLVPANYSSVSSSVPAGTGPVGVIVAKSGAGATLFRSVNDATQDRRIVANIIVATNAANTAKLVVSNSKAGSTQINNWRYNTLSVAAPSGTLVNFADLANNGASVKNYTAAQIALLNSENSSAGMIGNTTGVPDFDDLANDSLRLKVTDTFALNKYLDNVVVSTTDCDGLPAQVGANMDVGAFERQ